MGEGRERRVGEGREEGGRVIKGCTSGADADGPHLDRGDDSMGMNINQNMSTFTL